MVAALIEDDQGRWLLAQRRPEQHLAGLWEFPGGKCEQEESGFLALRRELHEELGIEIDSAAALMTVIEPRASGDLHLQAWRVLGYRGTPEPREKQAIRWLKPGEWPLAELAPADLPIARALALGSRYLITPDAAELTESTLLAGIRTALAAGVRAVRLRCADYRTRLPLNRIRHCEDLVSRHGGTFIVDLADISQCAHPGTGIHLRAHELGNLSSRPCAAGTLLLASCHSAAELAAAERLGVDVAVLSPLHATTSHPGTVALGWSDFGRLHQGTRLPLFALGGLGPGDLVPARVAGALGIAGISGLWPTSVD